VLGIRQRGIYCMKDTYVTEALRAGVRIERLEAQTGVRYSMLRDHYATWMLDDGSQDELAVLAEKSDPSLLALGHPRANDRFRVTLSPPVTSRPRGRHVIGSLPRWPGSPTRHDPWRDVSRASDRNSTGAGLPANARDLRSDARAVIRALFAA
jgi:hypothetical protein